MSKHYDQFVYKDMMMDNPMTEFARKKSVLEDIKGYQKLNNRQWKKKRELSVRIAEWTRYWIKDMEEIITKEGNTTIRFVRYGELQPKKNGRNKNNRSG